jgi:DNA-binding PadR family transcriptional regulator
MTSIANEWGFAPHRKRCGRGAYVAQMTGERGHRGFGGGPAFGREGFGPRRRGRRPRGDVRAAILLLLDEESRNGYQLMQEIEERSGGDWRPSPGSTYPALAQLEDEGLISTGERDGRKLLTLTDAGRKLVQERDSERPAPWEPQDVGGETIHELGRLMREVGYAFVQVMRTGSAGQIGKAREVLGTARRDLYRILADGDTGDTGGAGRGGDTGDTDPGAGADTVDSDS